MKLFDIDWLDFFDCLPVWELLPPSGCASHISRLQRGSKLIAKLHSEPREELRHLRVRLCDTPCPYPMLLGHLKCQRLGRYNLHLQRYRRLPGIPHLQDSHIANPMPASWMETEDLLIRFKHGLWPCRGPIITRSGL